MIEIKSIKPLFTKLITTADRYTKDENIGSLVDINKLEGKFKEYQKVVKIGSSVRDIKVGDLVVIDPTRYVRKMYDENSIREDFGKNPIVSIEIPIVNMDGKDYFMLDDRDILYIIDEYDIIPDKPRSKLIKPKKQIIV